MSSSIDYKRNRGFRLLNMFERLNRGEVLMKPQLALEFGISEKTVQRDLEDVRAYFAEEHQVEGEIVIKYNKDKNGYYLVRFEREWFTNEEVLAMCKILLESRVLEKNEMNQLISKLLLQAVPKNRKEIENIIRNELACYVPLQHGQKLLSQLWELTQSINACKIISFTYKRKDNVVREHFVKPVAIMFSEFYFYLVAYLADDSKEYPTIFRIDRMIDMKQTKECFDIPYSKSFSDGEFRKRVQFMYSGELRRVTFEYYGDSLEAVLDRLPTAEILKEHVDGYTIRAEVYGKGIEMWLGSQGNRVRLLSDSGKENRDEL